MKDKLGLFAGIAFFAVLFFLWQVQDVLTSFIIGMVLAYLLDPLVDRLEERGLNRTIGSLIPVTLFYVLCLLVVGVTIPLAVKEALSFMNTAPDYSTVLSNMIPKLETLFGVTLSLSLLASWFGQFGQELLQGVMLSLGKVGASAAALGDILSLMVITPLVAFYLLRAWPTLMHFMTDMIPPAYRTFTLNVMTRIDTKLAGFIRGQLLVCAAQGAVYAFGLWLVGIKMGILLGFMIGAFSIIPVIGGLMGFLLTLLVALVQFQLGAWVPYAGILAVFAVGNILESFVFTPKLVGDRVGLHPVWIIFALLVGGQIAGIVGMLVAVPFAIVLTELLKLAVMAWKKSQLYKAS